MKKYLIIYYSRTGSCKKAAEKLHEMLGEQSDIEEIIDEKDRSGIFSWFTSVIDSFRNNITNIKPIQNSPSNYSEVILVTPIWGGKVADAIRTYIAANKSDIKSAVLVTSAKSTTGEPVRRDILLRFALKTRDLVSLKEKDIKKGDIEDFFIGVFDEPKAEEKNEQ